MTTTDSLLDPLSALAEFNVLLHKTKKVTKRELSRQTPDCSQEQSFSSPLLICVPYRNLTSWDTRAML